MDQPVYWSVLVAAAVLAAGARLAVRGPLLPRRAARIGRADALVLGVGSLALAFHCAAMFFAPWTDALPGGQAAGDVIRGMGAASQWAYWLPATAVVVALRRLWWPAPLLLGATFAGVGVAMYWPYAVTTHLAWLAAAVLAWVGVVAALVVPAVPPSPGVRPPAGRLSRAFGPLGAGHPRRDLGAEQLDAAQQVGVRQPRVGHLQRDPVDAARAARTPAAAWSATVSGSPMKNAPSGPLVASNCARRRRRRSRARGRPW